MATRHATHAATHSWDELPAKRKEYMTKNIRKHRLEKHTNTWVYVCKKHISFKRNNLAGSRLVECYTRIMRLEGQETSWKQPQSCAVADLLSFRSGQRKRERQRGWSHWEKVDMHKHLKHTHTHTHFVIMSDTLFRPTRLLTRLAKEVGLNHKKTSG